MQTNRRLFPPRVYQGGRKTAFRLWTLTLATVLSLGCTSQASRASAEPTPVQTVPEPASTHSPSTTPDVQASATLQATSVPTTTPQAASESETERNIITLTVNNRVFEASLSDNPTVQRFIDKLPLTLDMQDLHRNEKFYYFQESFPTAAQSIGSLHAGDLMLYGDNCLVLFYKPFNTRHPYTRMGRITDTSGLSEALGADTVKVIFSKK